MSGPGFEDGLASVARMSEATSGTLIQDPAFRYALAGYLLLHGFIKKTQKNPAGDLELAHKRRKEVT